MNVDFWLYAGIVLVGGIAVTMVETLPKYLLALNLVYQQF